MTRTIISIAALLASTSLVQAASMPASPPKPTETSTVCTDDMVWDSDAQVCVIPEPAMFNMSDKAIYYSPRIALNKDETFPSKNCREAW